MINHTWEFCATCRAYTVICGNCGNNVCNGSSGNVLTGEKCIDNCDSAFELFQKETGPEPTEEDLKTPHPFDLLGL